MAFDLNKVLDDYRGQNFTLHSKYINPQLSRVLGTIEFDRFYVKGEGCYLIDDKGQRYLDFLSGFGVFALGRGHPAIFQALHDALDLDFAAWTQFDCQPIAGLLAERLLALAGPGFARGKVFFTLGGAEANENAIKIARLLTGRAKNVAPVFAEAGLAMEAALDRVGRELGDSYPSLSSNVYMATLEIRAGRTVSEALEHFGDRVGLEEARSFAMLMRRKAWQNAANSASTASTNRPTLCG